MNANHLQIYLKNSPVSLFEELVEKKKQEESQKTKPIFLSAKNREQLALET
jgi:hypothetical protein